MHAAVARGIAAPARPLHARERGAFERRYGTGLGGVRIHEGPDADASARALDAEAFTLGDDVVLGAVRPSRRARAVLDHELAHVLQQRGAAPPEPLALRETLDSEAQARGERPVRPVPRQGVQRQRRHTGIEARPSAEAVCEHVLRLCRESKWLPLDVSADDARQSLADLVGLDAPALRNCVRRLDGEREPLPLDRLVESLPAQDLRSEAVQQVLRARDPERNANLARRLLSHGLSELFVTDLNAQTAAVLLAALPPRAREKLMAGKVGLRLLDQLPMSSGYELVLASSWEARRAEAVYDRIARRSARGLGDEDARKSLADLGSLDDLSLKRCVRQLDDGPEPTLDEMIKRLPLEDLRRDALIRVLHVRAPQHNERLAKALLSYGALHWAITDLDAEAAAVLFHALPATARNALLSSELGERLMSNLPGPVEWEVHSGAPRPQSLGAEEAYGRIVGLLSSDGLRPGASVGAARLSLGILANLDEHELETCVRRLDTAPEAFVDRLITALPAADLPQPAVSSLLAARAPTHNAALAEQLLSYGGLDWAVTDQEAEAAAVVIQALPPHFRDESLAVFTERLRSNLPGSVDYEEGIGDQLLTGALLGDYREDPTFWSTVGQVAIGLVPVIGTLGDIRDTVAALQTLNKRGWTDPLDWVNLVLCVVGFVPAVGDLARGVGEGAITTFRGADASGVRALLEGLSHYEIRPLVKAKLLAEPLEKFKANLQRVLDDLVEEQADVTRARRHPAAPRPVEGRPGRRRAVPEIAASPHGGLSDRDALDAAIEAARRGSDATHLGRLVADVLERVREYAARLLEPSGFTGFTARIEDSTGVVLARRSPPLKVLMAHLRSLAPFLRELSDVTPFKAAQGIPTKDLGEAVELYHGMSAAARAMVPVDEAVGYLLRRGAIELSEQIGEHAADVLVRLRYPGAEWRFTGHGRDVVDLVYELGDQLLVVEAKGGGGRLGMRGPYLQGTPEYLDDVIAAMMKSSNDDTRQMGHRLNIARQRPGGLRYLLSETGRIPLAGTRFHAALRELPLTSLPGAG